MNGSQGQPWWLEGGFADGPWCPAPLILIRALATVAALPAARAKDAPTSTQKARQCCSIEESKAGYDNPRPFSLFSRFGAPTSTGYHFSSYTTRGEEEVSSLSLTYRPHNSAHRDKLARRLLLHPRVGPIVWERSHQYLH